MSHLLASQHEATLLDELDARQDEVLRQLDTLNERVEALLRQWSAAGSQAEAAASERRAA